ncbi:hypothetical protein [Olsenella sp. An293]|uniref:hypothetical protein n=1 Tax=Olsenella sp. An293 TaxID=1965626 RepID=UPI000B38A986|nr:hypothetical protein [Olsenella sp. An293]OUO31901.1 hypothetical protein B5F85_08580 [Olsenella sp. An293]
MARSVEHECGGNWEAARRALSLVKRALTDFAASFDALGERHEEERAAVAQVAYGRLDTACRLLREEGGEDFDAEAVTEPARRFVGDVEGYAMGAPYSVEGAALLALAKTDALLHEAWRFVPYRFSPEPCPTPSEVA